MRQNHLAICCLAEERLVEANEIAQSLQLPIFYQTINANYEFLMLITSNYIGIQKVGQKGVFYIDFMDKKLLFRLQNATLRKEMLAKSINIPPLQKPTIIDATAGIGRDSIILAALNYHVIAIEQSPVLYHLLIDAKERALKNTYLSSIMQYLSIINANSIEWLPKHMPFDVIYLDPMFPERKKTASVKKEMLFLQEFLIKHNNSTELFNVALQCAKKRVIVKRPRLAENIAQLAPNYSLIGKSSRFDIYLP